MLGQPSLDGFSEKVTAWAPLAAVRRTSRGQHLGVPDGGQGTGDEPALVGPAPLVDVPVVVGPDHGQGHVLVLGPGEELAAELGEGGEAQRAEHAVGVHVLDPLVDVVAAGPELVEGGRLEAVLLAGPSGHRVEGDVGEHLALVQPGVGAVVVGDELGGQVHVLGREAPVEEVRRLDDMVVHADHDHLVDFHRDFPLVRVLSEEYRRKRPPVKPVAPPRQAFAHRRPAAQAPHRPRLDQPVLPRGGSADAEPGHHAGGVRAQVCRGPDGRSRGLRW